MEMTSKNSFIHALVTLLSKLMRGEEYSRIFFVFCFIYIYIYIYNINELYYVCVVMCTCCTVCVLLFLL